MTRTLSSLVAGILILTALGSGCSSLQKEAVTKQYYDLSPQVPAPSENGLFQGETLTVRTFAINSAFDSHSFVYKIGENEYRTDYYNEFISYPSKLITEKTSEVLYRSIHFKPALTDDKKDITFRLSGIITRLSSDFTDRNNTRAIMEIVMVLEKNNGATFIPVLSNTYTVDEPIPNAEPSSLVSGWNTGLSKILMQFLTEFEHLPAS
ncbi:MAG: hypothetical protein A2464_11620 [Deltaproteobacteria bacterium RIFOXYC2_FULL_48_10]|nr:MAG: hypothetical protein A2464_11620 [Deltaproteobacteria bacterium RIFOXYC2_FULL_48_10]